jgi:hypothetical protein
MESLAQRADLNSVTLLLLLVAHRVRCKMSASGNPSDLEGMKPHSRTLSHIHVCKFCIVDFTFSVLPTPDVHPRLRLP